MAKQPPKPPAARLNGWGGTGQSLGGRRLLTSTQYAEIRRKLAEVDAKLREMTAADRPAAALVRSGGGAPRGEGSWRKKLGSKLLWNLAPKFDQCLRQSGIVTLQPWQQEIRDYIVTAKKPSLFAKSNLVDWARRRGLVQ
jgi:hypothetical protein